MDPTREGTFVTAVPSTKQRALHPALPRSDTISSLYEQLSSYISELDAKLSTVVEKHESDFFCVYKVHMHSVQQEMQRLKQKLNEDEVKRKRDSVIQALQAERDWFREEALRLDNICKEYKKSMEMWKNTAQTLEEDRKFIQNQIVGAERQNLRLRERLEAPVEPVEPTPQASAPQTPDRSHSACRRTEAHLALQARGLAKDNAQLKANLSELKRAKTSFFAEKAELEDFFYSCIDEVKKDIAKRRNLQKALPRSMTSKQLSSHHTRPDSVPYSQFTATDKRQFIRLLVDSEELVAIVKNHVLPEKAGSSGKRPGSLAGTRTPATASHIFSVPRFLERPVLRPSTAPRGNFKAQ